MPLAHIQSLLRMKYYAMINGDQVGPLELEQLPDAGVRPSTYIWCKGMKDWEKAEEVADVCRLFRNRIYDLMHPTSADVVTDINVYKDNATNQNMTGAATPSRFDRYLQDQPENQLPTLEEIDSTHDTSIPPQSMVGYAWLVTIFCFPITGVLAIYYAYKARSAWRAGKNEEAHDFTRSAKMLTGISFFMGFIAWSILLLL